MRRWWLIVVGCLFLWAAYDLDLSTITPAYALDYVGNMFPPDFGVLPELVSPLVETLKMAIVSIVVATIITVPLSLLAARDTTINYFVYIVSRTAIGLARAMPTLLWAILFVAMVGLGPIAGIFALTTHCIGSLGKFFSETIEAVMPQIAEELEAMRIDGAGKNQTIYYGVLPGVLPLFASHSLYYFEWCVREGATIGLVGAGGIGMRLIMTIRLFERQQTLAIVIVILAIIMTFDAISRYTRKRLLAM